jgi:hypothetical protein
LSIALDVRQHFLRDLEGNPWLSANEPHGEYAKEYWDEFA